MTPEQATLFGGHDAREAAIEAAAKYIYENKGDRKGITYTGWGREPESVKEQWREDVRETIDAYERALNAAGFVIVPKEPDTAMKRALLKHRGYDPDAKEETLDRLGHIDIATMGTFIAAYQAMVGARS